MNDQYRPIRYEGLTMNYLWKSPIKKRDGLSSFIRLGQTRRPSPAKSRVTCVEGMINESIGEEYSVSPLTLRCLG